MSEDLRKEVLADRKANRAAPLPDGVTDLVKQLSDLADEGIPCSFVFLRRKVKTVFGIELGRMRAERICADLGVEAWWK